MPTTVPQEPPDGPLSLLAKAMLKRVPKNQTPFLAVPLEIHLKIFKYLTPIDQVCFSLVNTYMYKAIPPNHNLPLSIGAPGSHYPVLSNSCRHCVPVLHYPAHCQLHNHIRPIIPSDLTYCSGACSMFTSCEQSGASDSAGFCGTCGVPYWRPHKRGRRMLDMQRPEEGQQRLRKWFNRAAEGASADFMPRNRALP